MPTVDGNAQAENSYGIVVGNGGAEDRIAGDETSNILQGLAAHNLYYGDAGDDTFKLVAKWADQSGAHKGKSTKFEDQFAVIFDFEGAGEANGDFIAFDGFNSSTLQLEHVGESGTEGAVLYYYSVQDMDGDTFNFLVNSLTGEALQTGDYAFY